MFYLLKLYVVLKDDKVFMTLHESSRKGDYLSPYSPTNPLKLERNSDLTLSLHRVASSIQFQRSFSISFPVSVSSSKRQNA